MILDSVETCREMVKSEQMAKKKKPMGRAILMDREECLSCSNNTRCEHSSSLRHFYKSQVIKSSDLTSVTVHF